MNTKDKAAFVSAYAELVTMDYLLIVAYSYDLDIGLRYHMIKQGSGGRREICLAKTTLEVDL